MERLPGWDEIDFKEVLKSREIEEAEERQKKLKICQSDITRGLDMWCEPHKAYGLSPKLSSMGSYENETAAHIFIMACVVARKFVGIEANSLLEALAEKRVSQGSDGYLGESIPTIEYLLGRRYLVEVIDGGKRYLYPTKKLLVNQGMMPPFDSSNLILK